MAEFYVADDIPQGVRDVTFRSPRVLRRSPHSSSDYRLEKDQINRELLLIDSTLVGLNESLNEILTIAVDGDTESTVTVTHYGTIIDNNEPTPYMSDNNLASILVDSEDLDSGMSLVGTDVLTSDLQSLARRVVALEQGR